MASGTLLAFFRAESQSKPSGRSLTFAERVAYQRAIEDVYWRHRIWPSGRPDSKPSLDAVISQAQLEKKVSDYLRKSQALEDYWQRPITSQQLQAELDRMARHTKQPEVLHELFEALGNDPFVIAECLARPALANRLLTTWYAYDQRIHGDLKQFAEADIHAHPGVEQMKQLSGKYAEIDLVKSDTPQDAANHGTERGVTLNSHEWDETVQRLAAMFREHHPVAPGVSPAQPRTVSGLRPQKPTLAGVSGVEAGPITQIRTGVISPLQEDETHYYATAVIERSKDHLKLATVSWLKEPLESWLAKAEDQVATATPAPGGNYRLPEISEGGCVDDSWTPIAGPPEVRDSHTAVWTGSEMIVWGGEIFQLSTHNTGGRYNPSTDTWTPTSTTGAPTSRTLHTAVWTGTEMIVWGGADFDPFGFYVPVNTGGRYNPNTDSWLPTSTTNAPDARYLHTAVLAGSEMIVWGGEDYFGNRLNTGGRYSPNTDSWTATSTAGAPAARDSHTAVWTGMEMVIWGGTDGTTVFNTGARYDPATNTWSATSIANSPTARTNHTAIWSGSEMVVWGGVNNGTLFNTGGNYNPGTDSWTATSTSNAPSARESHTAVWTGNEMIVWGGSDAGGPTATPTSTPRPTPTARPRPTPRPRP